MSLVSTETNESKANTQPNSPNAEPKSPINTLTTYNQLLKLSNSSLNKSQPIEIDINNIDNELKENISSLLTPNASPSDGLEGIIKCNLLLVFFFLFFFFNQRYKKNS